MNPSKAQASSVAKQNAARVAKDQVWVEKMNAICQGDADALSSLYDEASPLVFSVALRILENRADAEEVTLDVFTQVWKNANTWTSSRGSVTSWLILLARSRSLDKLRWRKSRTRLEEPAELLDYTVTPSQLGPSPSMLTEQKERIQFAMAALNESQRYVLDLAFFMGLTHQEIAERLDEPLGTIKSRIRSAMMKMKEVLGT